tara:strand:- start:44 stop:283 length:240 start_codon:yes stop_codon:yes gene_type:complete
MIANIIYVVVAFILIFVLYLAVKAITRGVEAKNDIKIEKNLEFSEKNNISGELSKITKLYNEGAINEEEFKKAKEKILS